MHNIVNRHGRRQAAGTDAALDLKRETLVTGRLADIDAQCILQGIQDFLAAADIAGRAQADLDRYAVLWAGWQNRNKKRRRR